MSAPPALRCFRLVRNAPLQRLVLGRADEFAPWFDVEELGAWGMPMRLLVSGVGAEAARRAITRAGGVEVER